MDSPEDRETIPHVDVMRVLLERAEFVRSVLLQEMEVIRDPATGRAEAAGSGSPSIEDDATRIGNAARLINGMHDQLFAHQQSRSWLTFVRCIDHAARQANQLIGAEDDAERARTARALYRRSFPQFEKNLTDAVVERAIAEWRKQSSKGAKNKNGGKHWVAIHGALKCFIKDPPVPESMSLTWRKEFPHLLWNGEKTKR
jgi:hypothetical protein